MKEKIQLLIKNEGLTQSRLAEMLEIQPANVSHILAGRSKPGFELLQKILRRFPRINPDWLLLDAAEMYRPETDHTATPDHDLGRPLNERPAPNFDNLFPGASSTALYPSSPDGPVIDPTSSANGSSPHLSGSSQQRGTVARVVVFYTDHTFESFEPKG